MAGEDSKGNVVAPIKGGIGMRAGKEAKAEPIHYAIGINPKYPPGLRKIKGGIGIKGKG